MTYTVHIRANCGCKWHPIQSFSGEVTDLLNLLGEFFEEVYLHAEATNHCIELNAEIRPVQKKEAAIA